MNLATDCCRRNQCCCFSKVVEWGSYSENLGAILKKHVEDRILEIPSMERNSVETLKTIISKELIKIKEEPEIFANLLKSYPARLDAVRKSHGGHTDY